MRDRRSVRGARSCSLLRQLVLGDNPFEPRDIFKQALAGQYQEVIAELRGLKVDFEQFFIIYLQGMPVLDAVYLIGSPGIGREKTIFSLSTYRRMLVADFLHMRSSG